MIAPELTVADLESDTAALAAAAAAAEEALCMTREALSVLIEGWEGQSGSAAADLVARHCAQGSDMVAELHRASAELASQPPATAAESGPLPALPPPASWAPGGMPLSAPGGLGDRAGLGGALAGLVAQIVGTAGTLGPGVDLPVEVPDPATGVAEPVEARVPAARPDPDPDPLPVGVPAPPAPAAPVPLLAAEIPSPVAPPAEVTIPSAAPPPPATEPFTEPLTAPLVEPLAPPLPEPATPCEIAADELPQVGE